MMFMMNHPLTRGSIVRVYISSSNAQYLRIRSYLKHIRSNDPLEKPTIDPRYFEEEYGEH